MYSIEEIQAAIQLRERLFADEIYPECVDESYAEVQTVLGKDWQTYTLPPAPSLVPLGGEPLNTAQAAVALREAKEIIGSVGTTGIYDKHKAARDWMRRYFPAYAEPGTW